MATTEGGVSLNVPMDYLTRQAISQTTDQVNQAIAQKTAEINQQITAIGEQWNSAGPIAATEGGGYQSNQYILAEKQYQSQIAALQKELQDFTAQQQSALQSQIESAQGAANQRALFEAPGPGKKPHIYGVPPRAPKRKTSGIPSEVWILGGGLLLLGLWALHSRSRRR